jgi:hypothetical protein
LGERLFDRSLWKIPFTRVRRSFTTLGSPLLGGPVLQDEAAFSRFRSNIRNLVLLNVCGRFTQQIALSFVKPRPRLQLGHSCPRILPVSWRGQYTTMQIFLRVRCRERSSPFGLRTSRRTSAELRHVGAVYGLTASSVVTPPIVKMLAVLVCPLLSFGLHARLALRLVQMGQLATSAEQLSQRLVCLHPVVLVTVPTNLSEPYIAWLTVDFLRALH